MDVAVHWQRDNNEQMAMLSSLALFIHGFVGRHASRSGAYRFESLKLIEALRIVLKFILS